MQFINNIKELCHKNETDIEPPDTIEVQPLEERKTVDIIVDRQVRTKYQRGWIRKIRKLPISEIVIHSTAGGKTAEGILRWMMGGQRAREYYKGIALFHYLIDREGGDNIVEIIDPSYWVWHSGSGNHDKKTIGIEIVNPSKTNREPCTEEQYTLLFNLIFKHLIPAYPTINQIVSHDYNRITYSRKPPKGCPGSGFDWSRLEREIVINKMKYNKLGAGALQLL